MGAINDSSAAVTALTKFYHTDETKFYPSVSSASEYGDEFFAITTHSSTTTNQTIIRFIKSADGTWGDATLTDAETSAEVSITGTTVGDFARFGNKVYYGNFEHQLLQIRTRHSSADTDADYVYRAEIPHPNAERVISRCDETAGWTYSVGTGSGSAEIDRMPGHRLEGRAAIAMSQEVSCAWGTMVFDMGASTDFSTFADSSTANESDFIALEIYRFNKQAISGIEMFLSVNANYTAAYSIPLVSTPGQTNQDNTSWTAYNYKQNSPVAQWQLDPYDNRLFSIRVRKSWWIKTGTVAWSALRYFTIRIKANSNASGTNPAKMVVDNVRMLKTPPLAQPFKIQLASCERQECGSSTGWLKSVAGTGTQSDFNTQFNREGIHCVKVTAAASTASSSTASLYFSPAKDLSAFPDGSNATASDVLKLNCSWPGQGWLSATWEYSDLASPRIRFIDDGAEWRDVKFGIVENLLGGGTESQISFNPEETAGGTIYGQAWTKSAGAFDWEKVEYIKLYGPYLNTATWSAAAAPYYIDDIRIERPDAMAPINIFEPLELIALDAISEFSKTILKDWSWVVELLADIGSWVFTQMNYQTYGMGHATYPDYEHSSVGIAGLRLTAYGSKNFGMTLKTPSHDLNTFSIMSFLWPPVFSPKDGKWGPVQFTTIPAGPSDRFEIWIATDTPRNIQDVTIKVHASVGGGAEPDRENYWEYKIPGQQIWAKIHEQGKKDKETEKLYKQINQYIDRESASKEDLSTFFGTLTNPSQYDQVKELVTDTFNYLGKDRGGWPSAVFGWKRSDMMQVRGNTVVADPDMSAITGHSVEVSSSGGNATICVDNFIMIKEGSLRGTYYYKCLLEDDEGFLSASSEPSLPIRVEKKNVVLDNVYTPGSRSLVRVKSKRIYRIGGASTEWLHVGNMMPSKTQFFDNVREENLGLALPEDAYGPPKAKVMRRIGNNMYYGNITDRLNTRLPYRLYQSEAFCPFRVNDFKCIDIPETKGSGITGLAGHYNHVIVFTSDGMWSTTRMLTTPVFRSDQGCVAKRSIVVSDFGVIWLSQNGLRIGDVSGVDRKFFTHVNPLFDSYTEEQLKNAIGILDGDYYYLFYDTSSNLGICMYLPDRSFSQLTGPFDVNSVCQWDGAEDSNEIYYGRNNGTIFQMFSGDDDDGTAITTSLRLRDFTTPGMQYTKYLKAFYVSMANLTGTDATLAITPYVDQIARSALSTITATTTTIKTYVEKAEQGLWGTHQSLLLTGTNRHKITEMMMKVKPEPDAEYLP